MARAALPLDTVWVWCPLFDRILAKILRIAGSSSTINTLPRIFTWSCCLSVLTTIFISPLSFSLNLLLVIWFWSCTASSTRGFSSSFLLPPIDRLLAKGMYSLQYLVTGERLNHYHERAMLLSLL